MAMDELKYKDGKFTVNGAGIASDNSISALTTIEEAQEYGMVNNPEWINVTTDSDGKIIEGTRIGGTKFVVKLESQSIETIKNDLQGQINDIIGTKKQIVCWGDSLTAGAGSSNLDLKENVVAKLVSMGYEDKWTSLSSVTYEKMIETMLDDWQVVNCGVGGESLYSIAARQGVEPDYVNNDFVLPMKAGEKVQITPDEQPNLYSMHTRTAVCTPLLQGSGNSVNPVSVEGILCTLSVTKSGYTPTAYYLTRNEDGDRDVTIKAGAPIIMQGAKTYRKANVFVLWCWQNGDYTSNEDLVVQLKKIIANLNTEKYVIVGLHSGNYNSRKAQEELLETEFGCKFFNWRRYVSSNACYDWNIEPTESDITAMENGAIPPSFLTDSVHLKTCGYMVLGYKLWERMTQLGYFD